MVSSILEPILFTIFINILDAGTACTFNKFADDTKLGGVVDRLDGCAAFQRDLDRVEKWTKRNLMEFSKGKCEVLPLGRNNPRHCNKLPREAVESLSWETVKTQLDTALSKLS